MPKPISNHFLKCDLKLGVLVCVLLASALPAQAITCTVPGGTTVNFGSVDVLSGIEATATASMTVSCTAGGAEIGSNSHLCLRVGDGAAADAQRGSRNTFVPRLLVSGTNYAGFQLYKDAGYSNFWGTFAPNSSPNRISGGRTWSSTVVYYARLKALAPVLNGTTSIQTVAPGSYTNNFSNAGGHTQWNATLLTTQTVDDQCGPAFYPASGTFPFTVNATVLANCKITPPNNIDFGTQPDTATNLQSSTNNLGIQCTRTTPYFIGLKPGNNSTIGAGVMLNGTDQVPYRLRKAAGMAAAIWGNTATTTSAGNGVAGIGTGNVITYSIFATVPSANAPVGSYSDTVTITVNY